VKFIYSPNHSTETGSGAGTNLKVGEGVCIRRKAPGKFFCCALHFFGSTSTVGYFGGRFRGG